MTAIFIGFLLSHWPQNRAWNNIFVFRVQFPRQCFCPFNACSAGYFTNSTCIFCKRRNVNDSPWNSLADCFKHRNSIFVWSRLFFAYAKLPPYCFCVWTVFQVPVKSLPKLILIFCFLGPVNDSPPSYSCSSSSSKSQSVLPPANQYDAAVRMVFEQPR